MKLWLIDHFAEFDHAYVGFLDAEDHPIESTTGERGGGLPASN